MKIIYPLKKITQLFKAYGREDRRRRATPTGHRATVETSCSAARPPAEIKASFYSPGPLESTRFLDLYLGNFEKNLHQLFEVARAHSPARCSFSTKWTPSPPIAMTLKRSAGRTLINWQFTSRRDGRQRPRGTTQRPAHPRRDQRPLASRPRRLPPIAGRFDAHPFRPTAGRNRARVDSSKSCPVDKPVHKLDVAASSRKRPRTFPAQI